MSSLHLYEGLNISTGRTISKTRGKFLEEAINSDCVGDLTKWRASLLTLDFQEIFTYSREIRALPKIFCSKRVLCILAVTHKFHIIRFSFKLQIFLRRVS